MISVVIPVLNNILYTRNTLIDIANNVELPYEIFLIDDASTEDILSLVYDFKGLNIKFIRHDTNVGPNYIFNEGFNLSTGDYFSFLNNDLEINKYFFKKLRETFEANSNVAIVCPYTIPMKKGPSLVSTSQDDEIILEELPKREGWASTYRSSFLKRIKLIPDFLRVYYGDDYLFQCAKLLGYDCLKISNNLIYHYRGKTVSQVIEAPIQTMNNEKILWEPYASNMNKDNILLEETSCLV
jgi:GT2 family glycosyltransferase